MMSAPLESDLLQASSWTCSNRLARNPAWLDGTFGGWLEGNAVAGPDGGMVDCLRVDCRSDNERAAIIHVSPDGARATFDPNRDMVPFPGGCKKFTIRYDHDTHRYWSLTNEVPTQYRRGQPGSSRNTLTLTSSPDLQHWTVRSILLQHPDVVHHGFQYADWQFDGPDIIAVVRTAFDDGAGGAHNYHDANYLTFHRVTEFRTLR